MNRLTKKLVKQATTREMVNEGLGGGYFEDELDPNKLIELTVNECIKSLEDNTHLFGCKDYQDIIINHMKNKFNLPI